MLQACEPENKIRIEFEGRLDTAKCTNIEMEVRNVVTGSNAPIEFDLGKADFVSSSFLRLCIYAYKQAGSRGFQIVNVNPMLKRVFKIAGLDVMLKGD